MVSMNGISSSLVTGAGRTHQANKNKQIKKAQAQQSVGQTSKVSHAVAHSIQQVTDSQIYQDQLQYDLPEGRGRKAMEEYMGVMNQAKREAIVQMLGVDVYI